MAPVRRHLAAGVGRVVLRADGGQKHLARRHAERQAERAIAVVREEPVVARAQLLAGGDEDGLVAGAADLEERLLLVLELDLLVVDFSRQEHQAIGGEQLVARQSFVIPAARFGPWARVSAPLARLDPFIDVPIISRPPTSLSGSRSIGDGCRASPARIGLKTSSSNVSSSASA